MTQEYPKMLYVGDSEQYSCRAVQDSEEEQQYRDMGFMDYVDLPEPEPKVEEVAPSESPQGFVTTEQFDAVAERLAAAEAEIQQLKGAAQQVGDVIQTQGADYNALTKEELQTLIVEQGKTFKANDTKAELIAILES